MGEVNYFIGNENAVSGTFIFKPPIHLKFEPKEDITAYELSQLMVMALGNGQLYLSLTQNQINNLPEGLKRHLSND